MTTAKGVKIAGLFVISLTIGWLAHFLMFIFLFDYLPNFNTPGYWVVALFRMFSAFLIALLCLRYVSASRWVATVLYLPLDSGPIHMAAWALFNYSETGKIGFNAAGWILPAIADLFAFLVGRHLGLKFTKLANQALNPTRARVAS